MAKRSRKSYSDSQRTTILTAAQKEGLTALQVEKKFGVRPVTYYSWRKKKGLRGPRGRKAGAFSLAGGNAITAQVRAGVQAKVREVLPSIVRDEVAGYLDTLFGATGRRRPGRPRLKA
jgi:transposase-like protein